MCKVVFAKLSDSRYDQTESKPYLLGSQSDPLSVLQEWDVFLGLIW